MNVQKMVDKAKVHLMSKRNFTFIATVLLSLRIELTEKVPTAAVDGITMYINPIWFAELTEAERMGLLAHETWHVILNHMKRGKGKTHDKYNIAADHVINIIITDAGLEIPAEGYCNYSYRGLSTKQVYDLLPDDEEHNGSCAGMDIIYDVKEDIEKNEKIDSILIKAVIVSKMKGDSCGNIPGELLRAVDELLDPKLPWQVILQNYLSDFAKEDYSYRRPNRRYLPDFYIPSNVVERLTNISVAIDLSGSITHSMLVAFLTEVIYIHEVMKPEILDILGFDTQIRNRYEIEDDTNILDLEFKGGGGTKITPVLKAFNKTMPTAAIIFTDMQFENYTVEPNFPILWVVIDNPQAEIRHGEAIHYSTED